MNVKQAYNIWANQYDTNINRTRDLEAVALQHTLAGKYFDDCLETGCGTGKNTEWLLTRANHITAIDLSDQMLAQATTKIHSDKVRFIQADILEPWTFATSKYDLITFSLVLEHIENLERVFYEVSKIILSQGFVYIGELHPFKQYTGTKARFETAEGQQILTCFNHHISDFVRAAKQFNFKIVDINEYFDEDDKTTVPRIFTLLLKNKVQA
jgi:ubiquinone/menaquinone biosynthesis C-methylase UbiE